MRVLLAYDGSEGAKVALESLDRAGLPSDTEILVFCAADVFTPPSSPRPSGVPSYADRAIEQSRRIAEEGAQEIRRRFPTFQVNGESVADQPAWAIIKRAEGITKRGWSADLVILGYAGHSVLERFFLGSVAHHVLTNICRSVRIVRQGTRLGPQRLLLGVDGSADSMVMVREVSRRNWPKDSQLRVLTAIEPGDNGSTTSVSAAADVTAAITSGKEANDKAVGDLQAAGLETQGMIRQQDPIHAILEEADSFKADCIFVGARGLTRIQRFVLGTVSTSVAMRATCTVEVVHPPKQVTA